MYTNGIGMSINKAIIEFTTVPSIRVSRVSVMVSVRDSVK